MDALFVLPAVVTLWSAVFLAQVVKAGRSMRVPVGAWIAKTVLALAGVWAAAAYGSEAAVYGVSIAWGLLLLAPSFAAQAHARALMRLDYPRAGRFAQVMRLLHPFDGWRSEPELLEAVSRVRSGDVSAIDDLRARLDAHDLLPAARGHALSEIARLTGDWDALLSAPSEPGIDGLRLRALGETGRLAELVDLHGRLPPDPVADLMLLGFGGRLAGVEALLGSAPFATMTAPQRDFWRATAALLADPNDDGAKTLLEASAEGPQREALIARRLNGGLASPDALSPDRCETLERVEEAVLTAKAEGRLAAAPAPASAPLVTYALILANVAAFGAELWLGGLEGPTDLELLYSLGAMWPASVLQGGEWYRLFAAAFLHFGALHLGLNMLALLVFGRIVENRVGRIAMAAVYLVTGVGSMAGALLVEHWLQADPTLLVGASGAIFGVVGVFAGLLVRDAFRRAPDARRGLTSIAIILVAQVAFDLVVPQVSMAAHACGFTIGLPLGLLLGWRRAAKTR